MATYTGLILVGVGHPNDDGLMYSREPRRVWLSENSRPAWCLDIIAHAARDGRSGQTIWIPKCPASILEDGLLMVATLVVNIKELRTELLNALSISALPSTIDLGKDLTSEQHSRLIQLSRESSHGWCKKLIIANFHGCSMLGQLLVLEHYGYDVEVLTPTYTRLYSRWLKATVIRGSLRDLPEITNQQIIKH
jgi:hypothetical protein